MAYSSALMSPRSLYAGNQAADERANRMRRRALLTSGLNAMAPPPINTGMRPDYGVAVATGLNALRRAGMDKQIDLTERLARLGTEQENQIMQAEEQRFRQGLGLAELGMKRQEMISERERYDRQNQTQLEAARIRAARSFKTTRPPMYASIYEENTPDSVAEFNRTGDYRVLKRRPEAVKLITDQDIANLAAKGFFDKIVTDQEGNKFRETDWDAARAYKDTQNQKKLNPSGGNPISDFFSPLITPIKKALGWGQTAAPAAPASIPAQSALSSVYQLPAYEPTAEEKQESLARVSALRPEDIYGPQYESGPYTALSSRERFIASQPTVARAPAPTSIPTSVTLPAPAPAPVSALATPQPTPIPTPPPAQAVIPQAPASVPTPIPTPQPVNVWGQPRPDATLQPPILSPTPTLVPQPMNVREPTTQQEAENLAMEQYFTTAGISLEEIRRGLSDPQKRARMLKKAGMISPEDMTRIEREVNRDILRESRRRRSDESISPQYRF